ncbi:MAG: hypothetical protein PHX12_12265, partial [Proteiniphilum sp.]|nr:hypothetical protein [Proteiniphilum sp.]
MKIKLNRLFGLQCLLLFWTSAFSQITENPEITTGINHRYIKTSYANESVELKNSQIQIQLFKRLNGWGWGEISTGSGKFMAVLEHLGEIKLRDQDIPMQLVADSVKKTKNAEGETLEFAVRAVVVRDVLNNTSFDNWMVYPFTEPVIFGKVSITLVENSALLR